MSIMWDANKLYKNYGWLASHLGKRNERLIGLTYRQSHAKRTQAKIGEKEFKTNHR